MIDQPSPPFRTGDTAYTQPAPGGYASAAAVPTDPAFSGSDAAYAVPSLGGEFQPGSGQAAPTNSPISKGADADGGAQDIADAPRIDEPAPPAPNPPAALAAEVEDSWIVFTGVAEADAEVDVEYTPDVGPVSHVITEILEGDTAAQVAAKVAARLAEAQTGNATQTGNGVLLLGDDNEALPGTLAVTIS